MDIDLRITVSKDTYNKHKDEFVDYDWTVIDEDSLGVYLELCCFSLKSKETKSFLQKLQEEEDGFTW